MNIEYISVSNLHFDPENPRLPTTTLDRTNEAEVINWMLRDASIIELMGSIGEKGFFPAEPLLVVEIEGRQGHYNVVEGNRRLTAVKLLLNPELAMKRAVSVKSISDDAKFKPDELPTFTYDKRADILDYLGFKHITGVKSWSALSKAKYLKSLKESYAGLSLTEQYKSLARAIGSRSDYVQQLLVGLSLFQKISEQDYFDIPGLNEEVLDFGVYYNALRWSNIRKFLKVNTADDNPVQNIDLENLESLVKWVSEKNVENKTRLGESRNLGQLNKILGSTKALEIFESGKSLDEAILYTEEPYEIFKLSISDSLNQIQTANKYIHLVEKPNELDLDNLKEIRSIAHNLRLIVESKLFSEED